MVTPTGNAAYRVQYVADGTIRDALRTVSRTATKLDLSGNVLTTIDQNDFYEFYNLRELDLSNNVIAGDLDLRNLQKLETLHLNANFVGRVILGPSVKSLSAVRNNITAVTCTGRTAGKKFTLPSNKISWLQDLSPECRQGMEELDLQINDIEVVDFKDLFASRDTLKKLNLAYNFIYDVQSTQDFVFRQLQTLNLKRNKIAFMSNALNVAAGARVIDLSENKLVLIDEALRIPSVPTVDLRNNEFQCKTLEKYFKNHSPKTPAESCDGKLKTYSGLCCEDLNAPFADRLIAMKRKEQSLYQIGNTNEEEEACKRENEQRQAQLNSILGQIQKKVDEATRQKQQKIQLDLEKANLQSQLQSKQDMVEGLRKLLNDRATDMNIHFSGDTLNTINEIVQRYDNRYNQEQNKQREAVRNLENNQKKLVQLLEEQARLEKQNRDAETALNTTITSVADLEKKVADLTKFLSERDAKRS